MLTSNGYVLDESPKRLGSLTPTPDAERDDHDALWSRMRRQGYLWLPGLLPADDILRFREYYFTQMAETGLLCAGSDPAEGRVGEGQVDLATLREVLFGRVVPSAEYEALCAHPVLVSWFTWFLGEDDVHLHKRKIIRHVSPGAGGIGSATQAHYDLVYLREGTDRVLSAWIPLGDTPVSLGGLAYLEGSHLRVMADEEHGRLKRPAQSITADLPALADEQDSRWLVADYRTGDVVIHSAHIIHAATDNTHPERLRLSTDLRYQRVTEPIDWRWSDHWHDNDGF